MDKNLLRAQLLMEAAELLDEYQFDVLNESVEANRTKIFRMLKECFKNVKKNSDGACQFIDDDGNKITAIIVPGSAKASVASFDTIQNDMLNLYRDNMRDSGGRLAKIADSGAMKVISRVMNKSSDTTAATGGNIIMLGSDLARLSPNQFRAVVYHEIGHLRLSHVGSANDNSEDKITKTMLKNTPRRSQYSFGQRVNTLMSANDEHPIKHAIFGSKDIKDGTSEKAGKRKEVFTRMSRSVHGGIGHGIATEGEADEYSRQHGGDINSAVGHLNDVTLKRMKKSNAKRATDMGGKIASKLIEKSTIKAMKQDTKARQKMAKSVKPEYKNLYKNF